MTKHCDICNIDLLDEYAYKGHLSGKRHLKNVQQIDVTSRSVYIYWGHNRFVVEDFLTFLSSFAEVVNHKFGPHLDYGIFQFQETKTVDILLKTKLVYNGTKLEVRPRTITKNTITRNEEKCENDEETKSEIDFTYLKPIFERMTSFDDQLASFLKQVALSDSETDGMYDQVCFHLNRLFRQAFPKCRTYRFGSTVTGLCFKNCDLDIYMNIGEQISNDENENSPGILTFRRVFSEAKKLLFRKSHFYSKVIPIPRAKTPIIKFFNIPSKTSCDLSFRNSLGVHNSLLIKHYLKFDPRLKPLMMLIKYWARDCEISTETSSGRITNYALVLLFIFYLEQPNVNLVPPIMQLKESCKPEIIDGWQVNFNKRIQHPSAENKKTIPELLHGFFEFYANFDFKETVICPIDGCTHPKESFDNVDSLPNCMDSYKEYVKNTENPYTFSIKKPMCVQDPNELNHNCTGNVTPFILEVFQRHASTSAEVCDKSLKNNESSQLLLNLFLTKPEISKPNTKKIIIPIRIENFLHIEQSDSDDNDNSTKAIDDGKFTKENLFDTVLDIVKNLFIKVYLMKVDVLAIDREQKQQKIEIDSDVHTKDSERIVLECIGEQCFWKLRKIKSLVLDPSYSILEKEVIITNKMIENKQNSNENAHVNFLCAFEKCQNPLTAKLILSSKTGGKAYKDFSSFLRGKIPSIVERTLSHMVQYKKSSITFERIDDSNKE